MASETESVLDRRLLRRRLTWWRAAAVIAVLVVIGIATSRGGDGGGVLGGRQIARVAIEGTISEDRDQLRMLKRIAEDKRVAGVLLYVNSPGGTTAGGEALFEAIREVSKSKPIVAQFGTMATSAAYICGLAADRIVARGNTITGSVGVIMQWPEVAALLDKLGVKTNEVWSGPFKAIPSPFQPLDENGKAIAQALVMETQKWFLGLVASRRGVDTAAVTGLEQGRIYSGREALTYKLIDQIGGEADAIAWMEQARNVPKNLQVVTWKPERETDWSWKKLSGADFAEGLAQSFAAGVVRALGGEAIVSRLRLDGLVSVWQFPER